MLGRGPARVRLYISFFEEGCLARFYGLGLGLDR